MNDYQQILERAHKWRSDKWLRYNLSMARRHDAEAYHILTQLLAALDAAQPVAWVPSDQLAEVQPGFGVNAVLYGKGHSGYAITPLFLAPPAADYVGDAGPVTDDDFVDLPAAAVPAGWREHVEDRIRTWRQSFVNRHGDQLEILDFMGSDSLDDLIDYVCSGQVQPAQQAQQPADAWINLYRRAVDVANDLTNYVEDRPKLLGAERKLDAIENEARALIAANKENTNGNS